MKDKPTLDDLFMSKKLDQPDEEFWNGFQDRVKGRAIASFGARSKSARVRRVGLYICLPVFLLSYTGWNMIKSESELSIDTSIVSTNQQVSGGADSLSQLANLMQDGNTFQREGAIQLASMDSYESFANTRVKLSDSNTNFNHHTLSLSPQLSTLAQYTF
ncbi:hypothetical protein OAU80_02485 [Opitutales bacterium]|uniref:hypothetical protein n=1 Tax=Candidatus Chordibacter forsetii TaxID=3381758 RepID=UPI00231C8BA7|nr:hypothetical protein [Opitutales bacterium]MDC3282921.1 hypothetical protein [Opitutales bacterium]